MKITVEYTRSFVRFTREPVEVLKIDVKLSTCDKAWTLCEASDLEATEIVCVMSRDKGIDKNVDKTIGLIDQTFHIGADDCDGLARIIKSVMMSDFQYDIWQKCQVTVKR